ncbi:MAG: trypsin-like peptidase domain-containing protein, partial [Actinomycetota bacterium]
MPTQSPAPPPPPPSPAVGPDPTTPMPVPTQVASPSPSPLPAAAPDPTTPMPAPTPLASPPSPTPADPDRLPPSVPAAGWSALGATPSAPPAGPPIRPATPAAGSATYLPPVAPPSSAPTPITPAKAPGRWGWRAFVAFLAGGLVAAGGFGAAQLNRVEEAAIDTTPVTTIATRPPIRDSGPAPITPPTDGSEPAAFVAQTLGPSVVQIDTDFGVGSGVIFGDGLILTNNHVIEGATTLRVKLDDGRVYPAELVGQDVNTDVAVVSVGEGLDLPIATLATGEKAVVGQVAIAIGSPFDLQQSVTAGIVSAVDRPIPNSETSVVAMIQTDAPINPGNSGGALADRFGRVIGINTSIQTDGLSSDNAGVGFAIPIDTAIRIADLLVAGQPIQPGFLGVRGEPAPEGELGVTLTEVTEGSAAEIAGLLVGDRVLSFNDAPVTEFVALAGRV